MNKLLSIGDLIDKLVIENIKIFNLREKLHDATVSKEDAVKINETMMILNTNRSVIASELDEKVENVISGKERNSILKKIKTYK